MGKKKTTEEKLRSRIQAARRETKKIRSHLRIHLGSTTLSKFGTVLARLGEADDLIDDLERKERERAAFRRINKEAET